MKAEDLIDSVLEAKAPAKPSDALVRKALKEAESVGASYTDYELKLLPLGQIKAREGEKIPPESLIDSALMIHHDIFRKEANPWTKAMVKCGVDAYLHKLPAVEHLIVYNPNVIKVLKEEPWAEAKTEALIYAVARGADPVRAIEEIVK